MINRHSILILLLIVGLGLVLNVIIAWSCALWSTQSFSNNPLGLTRQEFGRWINRSPSPFLLRPGHSISSSSLGLEYDLVMSENPRPLFWHTARAVRAGFPLPSLYGERWSNLADQTAEEHKHVFVSSFNPGSIGLKGEEYVARLVPYRPVFPGAITNTIFYAVLVCLIRHVSRQWRSFRRFRNRRCPGCDVAFADSECANCNACGWIRGITNYRDIAASRSSDS